MKINDSNKMNFSGHINKLFFITSENKYFYFHIGEAIIKNLHCQILICFVSLTCMKVNVIISKS